MNYLTVASGRTARAFNRSGATWAVVLEIGKDFSRVWHTDLLQKLKSYGISGQILYFISSFLSNRWLWVVLNRKSLHEYPVNAGVLQGSISDPTLFLLYINNRPDDFICNIAIYADDSTLYSKCDQSSYLCQQPELTSEHESDLQDIVDWGRKWLIDFNAGKTQLVLFDWSNNSGAIDVKIDATVLGDHLLRCWGWLSFLNWIGALEISLLLKLPPKKVESWFLLWSFCYLRLFCISENLPYGHAWNTVVMSGLVLLALLEIVRQAVKNPDM